MFHKEWWFDEADEFVAGPQNKVKRPGESNSALSSKKAEYVPAVEESTNTTYCN